MAGDTAQPEPVVYDLMAGSGEIWPHLVRHLGPVRIVAIDISKRMHLEAVERLNEQYADRITHVASNVLTHDLPQGGADMIVSSFGLKTFSQDQQRVLAQQVARTLRP